MTEIGPEYIRSPAKRRLDIGVGSAIALGASIPGAATALEAMIEHRTLNPIFRQARVGRMGAIYMNYKFQSLRAGASPDMLCGPEHDEASLVGSLIRKAGLDEIPQLYNVLRGDISLVGIRPVPPEHLDQYREFAGDELFERWYECYQHNPGLTGRGQLFSNRFPQHTPDVITARMEIDIDSFYGASLANDLHAIRLTPRVLLSPTHASPEPSPAGPS